jgi:xylan 1,4-beta-xylosidase
MAVDENRMKMKKYILLLLVVVGFVLSNSQAKCQANGYYQNPVLGGDYPDPSVLRVGKDYYMTHSSFEYLPGLLVWHSTDLVHWERVAYALNTYVGSVWAPDLVRYNGTFYIYFPAGRKIWVVTSKSPGGPWSEPIDTKIQGFIDPGHFADGEGNRYLYLSGGYTVKLKNDGLSADSEPVQNYSGWQFPKDWSTECFCLESPKSTVKNGYFYQTVAEGGTAGPATAHMVVSARSKTPFGPWENSPYNPIVHTDSRAERWWCQGHGTLVDDINGNWWILYHGYEKFFQTLGRQTLILPVKWTADNWFRVPAGKKSSDNLPLPAGKKFAGNTGLSDDFSGSKLGLQWQFFKKYDSSRLELKDGQLILKAEGEAFASSSPLIVNSADRKYEIQVEYSLEGATTAGLCLFYNEQGNMRIAVDVGNFTVFNQQSAKIRVKNELGNHGFLRILNDENEISFYFSADGKSWNRAERSIDATGFNHNVFGGFMSLRAGIFAFGTGLVKFDNFIYKKL